MRVCEFLNPGIFWGCPQGTGMSGMRVSCVFPHAREGASGDDLSPTVGVAVLGLYRIAHRIDRSGAHAGASCA